MCAIGLFHIYILACLLLITPCYSEVIKDSGKCDFLKKELNRLQWLQHHHFKHIKSVENAKDINAGKKNDWSRELYYQLDLLYFQQEMIKDEMYRNCK